MGKITAAITGVGLYLPDYILTNEELSTMVDTSDEWIMSHTGIKTRHILKGEGVGTSYMGARAVINLLDKAGVDPMEVDLVICVNRRVTVHEAGRFDAAAANAVYHHEVNLIKHDHDCFCNCKHADCGRKEGR